MTAAPTAPGGGLPLYQPATAVLAGTWSVPLELRPRSASLVRTPMAGMVSNTGGAVRGTVVSQTGSTLPPDGAGTGAGLAGKCTAGPAVTLATATPAVPAPTASSPRPSTEAASSRPNETRHSMLMRGIRRDSHRRMVVTRTRPHEGFDPVLRTGTGTGWSAAAELADRSGHSMLTRGIRRDSHRRMVVARTWPHEGLRAVSIAAPVAADSRPVWHSRVHESGGVAGEDLVADRGPLKRVADALGEVVLRLPAQQAPRSIDAGIGACGVTRPAFGIACLDRLPDDLVERV